MTKKKCIIILAASLLGSKIAWELWKYMRKNNGVNNGVKSATNTSKNKELGAADGNEVLMFTEDGKHCRDHTRTESSCAKENCPVGNVQRIYCYLSGALKTLNVCMYVMTCDHLTRAIIKSHRKGACVRVIIDSGMSELPACNAQILLMRRAGIEVRMNQLQTSSLMHHKFAVIDGEFLLLGSTNWTTQAFYGNNDSIIVTKSKKCVDTYSAEFDKMWRDFAPTTITSN